MHRSKSFLGVHARDLSRYYLWLVAAFAALYLISLAIRIMPSCAVAIAWAALSVVSMVSIAYQIVLRKARRQFILGEGGRLSSLNNGRWGRFAIGFVVCAFGMAGFIIGSVSWDGLEWAMIFLAGALLPCVYALGEHYWLRDIKNPFRKAYSIAAASFIVALVICVVYCLIILFQFKSSSDTTLLQAFLATPQYFEHSGSTLLKECGVWLRLADAWASFGFSEVQAAFAASPAVLIMKLIVSFGGFFGAVNLFSVGMIFNKEDLRKIFDPIASIIGEGTGQHAWRIRDAVFSVALPFVLIGAFAYAESQASAFVQNPVYTMAQETVRAVACISVYEINGEYYDKQKVDERLLSESLSGQFDELNIADKEMIDTTNEIYDGCLDSVNRFLDWYYGVGSESRDERAKLKSQSAAEDVIKSKFRELVVGDEASRKLIEAQKKCRDSLVDVRTCIEEMFDECRIDDVSATDSWLLEQNDMPTQLLRSANDFSALKSFLDRVDAESGDFNLSDNLSDRLCTDFSHEGDFATMVKKIMEIGNDTDLIHAFMTVDENIDDRNSRDGYKKTLANIIEDDRKNVLNLYQFDLAS